jgi:DNA-binding winged helix-turn-helix (wHTH) protein
MQFNQNTFSINRKYLFVLLPLLFIVVSFVIIVMNSCNDYDSAKREILLRRIGHELLLQSGDTTSRVLPIEKISKNEYQIKFENELTFQTASLVKITKKILIKAPYAQDYIVNVLNCTNSSVVYGYAISNNKKDEIVSCIGRRQPKACYIINVKFKAIDITKSSYYYFFGSLSFLAFFLVFGYIKLVKTKKTSTNLERNITYALGSVLFDVQKRQLLHNEITIDLTDTETRLLLIFALSPNQIIERSRLQKEIWEDEGVIVGRSLDMFISKLRKKLELDAKINIVVIRSKGYKLEISE